MKRPLSSQQFREIYGLVPRLTVEVVIQFEEGVVLKLRQDSGWLGMWHIPGGTVYMGERLEEAVARVAREELGVEVEVGEMIGSIVYPTASQFGGIGWPVGIAFRVKVVGGEQRIEESETVKIFRDIPDNIISEQRDFLEAYVVARDK